MWHAVDVRNGCCCRAMLMFLCIKGTMVQRWKTGSAGCNLAYRVHWRVPVTLFLLLWRALGGSVENITPRSTDRVDDCFWDMGVLFFFSLKRQRKYRTVTCSTHQTYSYWRRIASQNRIKTLCNLKPIKLTNNHKSNFQSSIGKDPPSKNNTIKAASSFSIRFSSKPKDRSQCIDLSNGTIKRTSTPGMYATTGPQSRKNPIPRRIDRWSRHTVRIVSHRFR